MFKHTFVLSPTWLLILTFTVFAELANQCPAADVEIKNKISSIFEANCIDCHNSETTEGGVNLAVLLHETKTQSDDLFELWTKVEHAVATKKMPPEEELEVSDRQSILTYFTNTFVLKNGKPHIGSSPLRRLTNYELENTLEDLLHIKLKQPFNHSNAVQADLDYSKKVLPVEIPGPSGFKNDASQMANSTLPLMEYLKFIDFAISKFDGNESAIKEVLGISKGASELTPEEVQQILKQFTTKAFRGNFKDADLIPFLDVYRRNHVDKSSYQALLRTIKNILLSPQFLYRIEHNQGVPGPYLVQKHELATRLSYFLNGTMPDDELLHAADQDQLSEKAGLKKQIARLLNQPRRISLSEDFAAQWLGFDVLLIDEANKGGGPSTLQRAQYDELLYFFDELIKSDLSILELIDSDWIYYSNINRASYGDIINRESKIDHHSLYQDVLRYQRLVGGERRGKEGQFIYEPPVLQKIKGDRFGGVITSVAIMKITSAPERTSPIRRGVWLLSSIIGETIEAPKDVPSIEEAIQSLTQSENPSVSDILRAHTEKASCQHCHVKIDPLGLGLENFSPKGKWRTAYPNQQPVISNGILPNGKTFDNPQELKRELLGIYKEEIVTNIVKRMLSYSIGREIQPCDRITINSIVNKLEQNNYRMGVLIEEIVFSQQFQNRQENIQ
ncbi:MAG: hypothetical protein COA78_03190 [Blastopirellula sp.]|nr:MAG: hypothetical protein COA78_03190 [Blastopirellula sp.]